MRFIWPRLPGSDLTHVKKGVEDLKRRPLTGVWQIPLEEGDPDDPALIWPAESPIDPPPTLINGWTQGSTARFAYRWHSDGALEFRGYLTPGSSGTVAIILPEWAWPPTDSSFLTDIETSPSSFTIGRVIISSTTGEVTIVFPAS